MCLFVAKGRTRKIKTRGALRYSISRRDIFERFLKDGRVEVDSHVERAIKPQALRKNSLFAEGDEGATYFSSDDVLIIKEDFEPDPEISDAGIAWHRLRGARFRVEGRKAG